MTTVSFVVAETICVTQSGIFFPETPVQKTEPSIDPRESFPREGNTALPRFRRCFELTDRISIPFQGVPSVRSDQDANRAIKALYFSRSLRLSLGRFVVGRDYFIHQGAYGEALSREPKTRQDRSLFP